jgi:hypothetical protein
MGWLRVVAIVRVKDLSYVPLMVRLGLPGESLLGRGSLHSPLARTAHHQEVCQIPERPCPARWAGAGAREQRLDWRLSSKLLLLSCYSPRGTSSQNR